MKRDGAWLSISEFKAPAMAPSMKYTAMLDEQSACYLAYYC